MKQKGELSHAEQWAKQMIHQALDLEVKQHDDGSQPKMYDLRILGPDGHQVGAVEVTSAADPGALELWNEMNGPGVWVDADLDGGWMVHVRIGSRLKRMKIELPKILAELEGLAIRELDRDEIPAPLTDLERLAADLGVISARQQPTNTPGSIYLNFDVITERFSRDELAVNTPLETWIGQFLRHLDRAGDLAKLASAESKERHLFLFLPPFSLAPAVVTDHLTSRIPHLPTAAPDLPGSVTHLWVSSTWEYGLGLRWFPEAGWARFDKCLEHEMIGVVRHS